MPIYEWLMPILHLDARADLVVLDADLASATKTSIFKKEFPDRHFDCGIAEGNMVVAAAGMSDRREHQGEVQPLILVLLPRLLGGEAHQAGGAAAARPAGVTREGETPAGVGWDAGEERSGAG